MSRLALPLLLALCGGCAIAAGPTVGVAVGRGGVVGWEADVGTIPLHTAFGQSFRPAPQDLTREELRTPAETWERVDWLAAQSWLGGSVTAGVAASDHAKGVHQVTGVALAYPIDARDVGLRVPETSPFLLVGVGYRYLADAHEITLSAKAGLAWFGWSDSSAAGIE